jgi:hypothetical protein
MPINLPIPISRIDRKILGYSFLGATKKFQLAAAATEIIRKGKTAAQGGFFCYFSCPSRKVKRKNRLNCFPPNVNNSRLKNPSNCSFSLKTKENEPKERSPCYLAFGFPRSTFFTAK